MVDNTYNVGEELVKKAIEIGGVVLLVVIAVAAIQTIIGGNFIQLVGLI
jgi:hypothetical protein